MLKSQKLNILCAVKLILFAFVRYIKFYSVALKWIFYYLFGKLQLLYFLIIGLLFRTLVGKLFH